MGKTSQVVAEDLNILHQVINGRFSIGLEITTLQFIKKDEGSSLDLINIFAFFFFLFFIIFRVWTFSRLRKSLAPQ